MPLGPVTSGVVVPPTCADVPAVSLDPKLLASGDAVTAVQTLLGVKADGVYGPQTAAAVSVATCPDLGTYAALTALSEASGDLATQAQARIAQAAAQKASVPVQAAPVAIQAEPAPCSAPSPALGWIAWCESKCNPTNHNPTSTAAGKYQYLDTTWNDYGGYPTADAAPEYAQDQRAAADTAGGNYSAWNSSRGCWGGKF